MVVPNSSATPPKGRSRPRSDDRKTLNGVLCALRTGYRWEYAPQKYGSPLLAQELAPLWEVAAGRSAKSDSRSLLAFLPIFEHEPDLSPRERESSFACRRCPVGCIEMPTLVTFWWVQPLMDRLDKQVSYGLRRTCPREIICALFNRSTRRFWNLAVRRFGG